MTSRPLQIVFLDQYGGMAGGQRILLSLIRAADGHVRTVLAPGGGPLQTTIAREMPDVTYRHCDEPIMRHGRKGLTDLLRALRFAWRFRRYTGLLRQQDVIYVNGLRHLPHLLLWSMLGALGARARIVYHIHLDHSWVEKHLIRLADRLSATYRIVACSRFVMDRLGFSSSKIVLVENALDETFASLPFTDRFTRATAVSAAVIGTLRPEKGQDIAVAATSPDIPLRLIGPDGDGAGIWIAELKAHSPAHVSFDGVVRDIPQALTRLSIQYNLVPARWNEPFGLTAIEGMACSCLTIVSGRGGLAEIAAATGALVARDESDLADCLKMLERMPASVRRELARAQHDAALARYAPARFKAQIRAIFDTAA